MADNDKNNTKYQQLIDDVKEYVSLQSELLQVTVIEKMTKLLAKLILFAISFVMLILFMFYVLLAIAFLLEPVLGFAGSFAVISLIFMLILGVVIVFRKKLIVKPLMYVLIDVFKENDLKNKDVDGLNNSKTE